MKTLMGIAVLVIGGMLYAVTPSKVQEQPIASLVQTSSGAPNLDLPAEAILLVDATTNQAVTLTAEAIRYAMQQLEKRPTDGSLLSKPNTQATTGYPNGMAVVGGRKHGRLLFLVGCNSNATPTGYFHFTLAGALPGSDLNTNYQSVGHAISHWDCNSAAAGSDVSTLGDPICGTLGRPADANSAYAFVTSLNQTFDTNSNGYSQVTINQNLVGGAGQCNVVFDPSAYKFLVGFVRSATTWGTNNMNRVRVYLILSLLDSRRMLRCENSPVYC